MTRLVGLLLVLGLLVPMSPVEARPAFHPSQLAHVGDARQIVVVTAPGWRSTYATLRAYRLDAEGRWRLRFGPWRARLGYAGLAPDATRRQDTGTTPAGTYRMLWGFGSRKDPGTRLDRYVRFDENDWWPYDPRDPSTYNVFQRFRSPHAAWRPRWAERLDHWGRGEYRYGVVLDYNLPQGVRWDEQRRQRVAETPADTRRGGGIFLHVGDGGPTAGCVSIGLDRMRKVLRWLDADQAPRIVIGPVEQIGTM